MLQLVRSGGGDGAGYQVTVDALGRRKTLESMVKRDDSLPDAKVKKKLWQWRRK